MKKLWVISLVIFFIYRISFSWGVPAYAYQFEYARVNEKCPFYADESCRIVKFYIPDSFCVKIVSVDSEKSRVIFMDNSALYPLAEGYVKNIYLNFLDSVPQDPYPTVSITLKRDEVIFADSELSAPKAVLSAGQTAYLYGTVSVNGTEYLYVYSDGQVGYVNRSGFEQFVLPDLTPVDPLPPTESPSESLSASESSVNVNGDDLSVTNGQILVIAVIVICGLCVFYLILRPDRTVGNNRKTDDFDG